MGVEIIHTAYHNARHSFRKAIYDAMEADGFSMDKTPLAHYMVFYDVDGEYKSTIINASSLLHAERVANDRFGKKNVVSIKPA
jgi:hypothetical protein